MNHALNFFDSSFPLNFKVFQTKLYMPHSILSPSEISTNDDEISKVSSIEEKDNEWLNEDKNQHICVFNNNISKKSNLTKYKTEICRSWEENGTCSYGKKCRFAHGRHELVEKECIGTYKSKLCRSFHQKFYCPYGTRCLFIHDQRRLKQNNETNFYSKQINSINFNHNNHKRLPIFTEITKISEKNKLIFT